MKKQRWMMATAVALALAVGGACGDESVAPEETPEEELPPEVTPGTMIVSLVRVGSKTWVRLADTESEALGAEIEDGYGT